MVTNRASPQVQRSSRGAGRELPAHVAAVEAIGNRQREIKIAGFAGIDGGIVRRAVQMNRGGLFMIAVHQKERCRVGHDPRKTPLVDVELSDRIGVQVVAVVERVDIEVVAQRDVEIRPVFDTFCMVRT